MGILVVLVVLVCRYAHSAVSGDPLGGVLLLASQKFNPCPSLFSKPRQFPHSGEADGPASKVASHEMNPSSPRESRLPLLRRVRPAVAKVEADGDGEFVRMELVMLTAAGGEEITGQSGKPGSQRPNGLSWRGLPNISSISVDQSPESFDASESWRDEVLPNELE